MYKHESRLEILVNGRPVHEYYHEGKTFIEGRKGNEYSIKFSNDSSIRRKIVTSVDGLNVMTGDSTWERAYVVEPWGNVIIPGWRKDSDNVAAFIFSSIPSSYNQNTPAGDAKNVGVIGCRVFNEEKPVYSQQYTYNGPVTLPTDWYNHVWPKSPIYPSHWYGGGKGTVGGGTPTFSAGGGGLSSDSGSWSGTLTSRGADTPKSVNFVGQNQNSLSSIQCSASRGLDEVGVASAAGPGVGTGWGENTQFKTQTVHYEFEKYEAARFAIFYDSQHNLERRGVFLGRYNIPRNDPNPFPDGCPPPTYH